MKQHRLRIHTLIFLLLGICLWASLATGAFAADEAYIPLVKIPYVKTGDTSIPGLVNALYKVILVLGSIFAVFKIALAGAKYSLSAVVSDKSSALSDIKGVLLGLFILFIPFIVLNTINPTLTKLDVLDLNNTETTISGSEIGTSRGKKSCEAIGLTWYAEEGTCGGQSGQSNRRTPNQGGSDSENLEQAKNTPETRNTAPAGENGCSGRSCR